MQVACADNDNVGDKASNSCKSMNPKDVCICSFDWSHMFEVEEKLSKIAYAFRKLAGRRGAMDELVKAAVRSCGSDITVSWSAIGIPDIGVTCTVLLDYMQVAQADGKSFEHAEKAAFSKVASVLSQQYLQVLREPHLVGSDEPIRKTTSPLFPDNTISALSKFRSEYWKCTKETKGAQSTASLKGDGDSFSSKNRSQSETGGSQIKTRAIYQMPSKQPVLKLSELVIKRQQNCKENTSSCEVLESSAKWCDKKLRFCEEQLSSSLFHSSVTVDEQVIGDAVAESEQKACLAAIETVLSKCCHILVKNLNICSARNVITLQQILTNDVQLNIIPESNIGCKILRKQGWTSGGLGQNGRTNPVVISGRTDKTDKTGLGFKRKVPGARDVLRRVFAIYLRTHNHEDLIFSHDISKEIQAIIQKEAAKHGLQVSYCDSDQQSRPYIIVSRRRSVAELVEHIRANGGETQTYVLIEPKGVSDRHLKRCSEETLADHRPSSSSISSTNCHQLSAIESVSKGFESQSPSVTEQKKTLSLITVSTSSGGLNADLQFAPLPPENSLPMFGEGFTPDPLIKVDAISETNRSEMSISVTGSTLSSKSDLRQYTELLNGTVQPSCSVKLFDPNLFVIIKYGSQTDTSPSVVILDISSKLCGMNVFYEIRQVGHKKVTCSIAIAEQTRVVGTGVGETEYSAKVAAADNALSYLSQVCCTVIIKDLSNCEVLESAITPAQLIAMEEQKANTEAKFVGNDSISTDEVLTRRALKRIMSEYRENSNHEDLVFSPIFNSTDRNLIGSHGPGVVFFRFGKGGKHRKFFGLSRDRTPVKLVQFIKANGGETIRFGLVKPSGGQCLLADLREQSVISPEQKCLSVGHEVQVSAINNTIVKPK